MFKAQITGVPGRWTYANVRALGVPDPQEARPRQDREDVSILSLGMLKFADTIGFGNPSFLPTVESAQMALREIRG